MKKEKEERHTKGGSEGALCDEIRDAGNPDLGLLWHGRHEIQGVQMSSVGVQQREGTLVQVAVAHQCHVTTATTPSVPTCVRVGCRGAVCGGAGWVCVREEAGEQCAQTLMAQRAQHRRATTCAHFFDF